MENNKTCEHNWINKGTYKLCSVCGEIIQSSVFARMNGITPDVETDNYHFYQLEDEVEQSDVPHQNDKRD